jgi:hypothetical protein
MIPIISSTFAGEAPDQPGSIKYIVSDSALQSVAQRSGTSVARSPGRQPKPSSSTEDRSRWS